MLENAGLKCTKWGLSLTTSPTGVENTRIQTTSFKMHVSSSDWRLGVVVGGGDGREISDSGFLFFQLPHAPHKLTNSSSLQLCIYHQVISKKI